MKPAAIILSFFLACACYGQSAKEKKFKAVLQQVITAFSKQDSIALSKHINKGIGVYLLNKIGVFETYDNCKKVTFSDNRYPWVVFTLSKNIQLPPLTYAKLPVWSCEKDEWSKKGLFVDTLSIDHFVSKICKERNKNVPDSISAKTISFFYDLENKSRRIVLFDSNNLELVFYLSYLDGNWYLTVVDNASSDCSV
jgi:hypothetical protein